MASDVSKPPTEECLKEVRDDPQPPSDKEEDYKEPEGDRPPSSSEEESLKTPKHHLSVEKPVGRPRRRDTIKEWLPGSFGHMHMHMMKGLTTKDSDQFVRGSTTTLRIGSVQPTTVNRSKSERLSSLTERGVEKAKEIKKRLASSRKYEDPLEQWMCDHSGGTLTENRRPCSF